MQRKSGSQLPGGIIGVAPVPSGTERATSLAASQLRASFARQSQRVGVPVNTALFAVPPCAVFALVLRRIECSVMVCPDSI